LCANHGSEKTREREMKKKRREGEEEE